MSTKYPVSNPSAPINEAAAECAQVQLQQAKQIAAAAGETAPEIVAALVLAIALNKQSLTLKP
jgi:hypothetical protein